VPLIAPPVIATDVAFWVAIVPSPVTEELGITIAVFTALVNWPWALTVIVETLPASPYVPAVTAVLDMLNVVLLSDKPVPAE
jgi:hypothetical protein